MKKTIIILLSLIAIMGISSANDCKVVVNNENWTPIITKNRAFNNILPKKAFEKAVENLQIFCCKIEKEWEYNYCENIDNTIEVPSSSSLLDHILDVSLRRLDAKEENENGEDLIYGLDPDPMGRERRIYITEHWNSTQWSVPLDIINKYKKYWTLDNNKVLPKLTSSSNNIPRDENTFKDYQTRTLKERYNAVCESSIFIYTRKTLNKIEANKLYDIYNKCKTLIDTRIEKEYEYTNAIILQKWWVLLNTNLNAYLDKYFSQNKLLELQQIIFNLKTVFAEVNKAVTELVPKCN